MEILKFENSISVIVLSYTHHWTLANKEDTENQSLPCFTVERSVSVHYSPWLYILSLNLCFCVFRWFRAESENVSWWIVCGLFVFLLCDLNHWWPLYSSKLHDLLSGNQTVTSRQKSKAKVKKKILLTPTQIINI